MILNWLRKFREMNKIHKYLVVFNIIIFILLILILQKLNVIADTMSENIKKTEAIEILENYNKNDIELIIVGTFKYSTRYYFLTPKEDPEYFDELIEMFWGMNTNYVAQETPYQSMHSWQITFVNSLGEMLTLYVYHDNQIGYGGVGNRGVQFTLEGTDIDYEVVRQIMQEFQ